MKAPVILNAQGKPIVLNEEEKHYAMLLQRDYHDRHHVRIKNSAFGYEIPITTLTTIMKKISEQKFYHVPFADYLPVRVGEGAWSSILTTYRSFSLSDAFETGIVNVGGQSARMASADAGVDAQNIVVFNWGKEITWTIMELEQAAKAGSWELVTAKEEARKTDWDLGLQRISFLGAQGQNGVGGSCLGLLNQGGVNVNTTTITKAIKAMTPAELKVFAEKVLEDYRNNCNRTSWPTHFIIPESDYNGLASQSSPDFPMLSVLKLIEDMFKVITQKPGFKVLPLAYSDAAYHSDVTQIVGKQVYTLLNYDEKSVRMDIPVDYTNTLANSLNNFSFQNVGYGQFTGVLAYRPLEMLYFQY